MVDYSDFAPIDPELQISFWYRLQIVKQQFFIKALFESIKNIPSNNIESDLNQFVSEDLRRKVASLGMRDELFFMLPVIIRTNPQLVGYYRLLYGISQKELYKGHYGKFKKLEEDGVITKRTDAYIEVLCERFIECAGKFLIEFDEFDISDISDLQLLTVGPQFRGSNNNTLGQVATQKTFKLIRDLVFKYIKSSTDTEIVIVNALDREIEISFASDPDIAIVEYFGTSKHKLLSVEIKGGTDYSNIHNRIGEAEKSHQKAKKNGYNRFMTIISVDIDYNILRSESPTTNYFFNLSRIQNPLTDEYRQFKEIIQSNLSI